MWWGKVDVIKIGTDVGYLKIEVDQPTLSGVGHNVILTMHRDDYDREPMFGFVVEHEELPGLLDALKAAVLSIEEAQAGYVKFN